MHRARLELENMPDVNRAREVVPSTPRLQSEHASSSFETQVHEELFREPDWDQAQEVANGLSPRQMAHKRPRASSNSELDTHDGFRHRRISRPPIVRREMDTNMGEVAVFRRHEQSLDDQVDSLTYEQKACIYSLKGNWERTRCPDNAFPDEIYLRFARSNNFDFSLSWKAINRFDVRYLNLSIHTMETQLLSKKIFSVPGLRSKYGHHSKFMTLYVCLLSFDILF